jgi:hypothetical protein
MLRPSRPRLLSRAGAEPSPTPSPKPTPDPKPKLKPKPDLDSVLNPNPNPRAGADKARSLRAGIHAVRPAGLHQRPAVLACCLCLCHPETVHACTPFQCGLLSHHACRMQKGHVQGCAGWAGCRVGILDVWVWGEGRYSLFSLCNVERETSALRHAKRRRATGAPVIIRGRARASFCLPPGPRFRDFCVL